jgi:predicted phage terminase large subunit-like protein
VVSRDVYRNRFDYPELKAAVRALAKQYQANVVLVEDAGAGTALVQELDASVTGIIAVKPERDKKSRMSIASAKFQAGRVFLPDRAPWLRDFEDELFAFPGSRHDDQCDSVSQALIDGSVRFPMRISPEVLAWARQGRRRSLTDYWWGIEDRQRRRPMMRRRSAASLAEPDDE